MSTGLGKQYDFENRISYSYISGGTVQYFYDAQNKRIWQGTCTAGGNCQQGVVTTDTITLFGADGRQVGTYQWSAPWNNTQTQVAISFQAQARRAYFGGKLVAQSQSGVMLSAVQDRLGSVGKYYPYGEERNSPQLPNDQVKFATYTRDSGTGLDYADQRYYASTFGRFMTPDWFTPSQKPKSPGTWNLYAYATGDPIEQNDPSGMDVACYWIAGQLVCIDDVTATVVYVPGMPPPTVGIIGGLAQAIISQATQGPIPIQHKGPAFDTANNALDNPDCAKALGAPSPEAAKAALQNALVQIRDLGAPVTTVEPQPDGGTIYRVTYNGGQTFGGVITLNWQTFVLPTTPLRGYLGLFGAPQNLLDVWKTEFGLNSLTTEQFQAITLLHELGHVLNGLLPDTNNLSVAEANTRTVIEKCFPSLLK